MVNHIYSINIYEYNLTELLALAVDSFSSEILEVWIAADVQNILFISSMSVYCLTSPLLFSAAFCLPSSLAELQDTCSVVSDYDCPCAEVSNSVEDLLGLSPSLRDSEYFKDLEGGIPASQSTAFPVTSVPESKTPNVGVQVSLNTDSPAINQPVQNSLNPRSTRVDAPPPTYFIQPAEEPHRNFVVTQLNHKLLPGCVIDSGDCSGPAVGLSLTINLNGLLGTMETAKEIPSTEEVKDQCSMDLDGDPDFDSFPNLVRSMSTSRRHSWGVPVSPINLGRR